MRDDLVTAAVFGDQTRAVLLRSHLEEAGIPAFLLDENVAGGMFSLGTAIGGIRIQVARSRLEEALRIVEAHTSGHIEPVDWSEVDVGTAVDEDSTESSEDPDAEAEQPSEPAAVAPTLTDPSPLAAPSAEPPELTLREQRADRIIRGALFGLFCAPVMFLAAWRMVQIANSPERIRPEYQRKANTGAMIVSAYFFVCALATFFACCLPFYQLAR
jgi:Putative prokaryotic signal transducing protein